MRIVILPGLDGTDVLLSRFVECAPAGCTAVVLPLPDDPSDDYESLPEKLARRIAPYAPCHLVAESFSGPVGIRIASRFPKLVDELTLVATFANSPAPWIARWLPWSLFFRVPLPLFVARRYFVGRDREMADRLRDAIRRTSVATLTRRLHCVLDVDVRPELATLACPVRYLRPTRDRLVTGRSLREILRVKPDVTVHEIDGPHLVLQTRIAPSWSALAAPT